MVDKNISFFKVFLPCRSSHQLRLPPAVDSDDFPNEAILKDTNENLWHMKVEKDENRASFKDGWHKFVTYHSLEYGDFLVFRYRENSLFEVKIYGRNGCIKDQNELSIFRTSPMPLTTIDESIEGNIRRKSSRNLKRKSPEERSRSLQNKDQGLAKRCSNKELTVFKMSPTPVKTVDESIKGNTRRKSSRNLKWKSTEEKSRSSKISEGSNDGNQGRSQTISLKTIQPSKALDSSRFTATTNPHFFASVNPAKPFHLHIPKGLVVVNRLNFEEKMVFLYQDRKWPVKVCHQNDGRYGFTKGWRDFCKENDLGPRDKCRFEFVFLKGRGRKLSKKILVTILRARTRKKRTRK